jgi:hypothetical protein
MFTDKLVHKAILWIFFRPKPFANLANQVGELGDTTCACEWVDLLLAIQSSGRSIQHHIG